MLKIIAPATSANLGSGFDVFGIGLEKPCDIMKFKVSNAIKINVEGFKLPTSPEKNVAGIVSKEILKKFSINLGVEINIQKKIRPESGLGSSAA